VEIRTTGDDEYNDTIPEVNVIYFEGNHVVRRAQTYIAKDVAVGGKIAHAYLKASECEKIEFVFWKK
jgi:hypothetical protein